MKRFWQQVVVVEDDGGHRVELDRRPLRTPLRRPLVLPTGALADGVAAEWRAAGEEVDPRVMIRTRLASTVVDRMPLLRAAALDELMAYCQTDLVCYRASQPEVLVRLQKQAWDGVVAWLAARFEAPLTVTCRVVPIEQPAGSLERLRRHVESADDWKLVGLHALAQPLGSAALALAVAEGFLSSSEALAASLVDERFETERWGWDSEIERRQRAIAQEIDAAASFLGALDRPS